MSYCPSNNSGYPPPPTAPVSYTHLDVYKRQVLHRNFQGYTTQGDTDLLGMGVSAISMIGDCYAQNQKELKQYYQQVVFSLAWYQR